MVEGVREVTQISTDAIEHAPDFGDGVSLHFIKGMAKTKSGVCTLLNIQSIIGTTTQETEF